MTRVLAICSGGGHWVEMRRIMPAFDGLKVSYASVYPEYAEEIPGERYYVFQDFSRFRKIASIKAGFQLLKIVLTVRPDVVITTGSAPALLALTLSKTLLQSKTIWIDSIANCDGLSTSGSLAKYVADVWLTQWEHLATDKGPAWWGAVL